MADLFARIPRETHCAACGEPCLRSFRKTKDGRPWPNNLSICTDCTIAMVNAARPARMEAMKARLEAERLSAKPTARARPYDPANDGPEVPNG